MRHQIMEGIEIDGDIIPFLDIVLTPEALHFLANLHRRFNPQRLSLMEKRIQRQQELNAGRKPEFLSTTKKIREDKTWKIGEIPADLQDRKVEITGPTDRKMVINALNSGANVFMADFEDSLSPTWTNVIEGQINLSEAIEGTLTHLTPDGKQYYLKEKQAVLMLRPRGWHLPEKHLLIDGTPISASLFDFGLFFLRNAKKLIEKGSGPYFYLPKIENHLEARLWNDIFVYVQDELKIPQGTIKATVLVETILAAFEMDEILYELKEHSAGLNAGRWDYIFSIIKKFKQRHEYILPDRGLISMTVPFMHAYTDLLVQTCHKRGAHAMGGMAAFIPNRKDPAINDHALKKVREDKIREVKDGFDGTWVAHPDLVPVAMEVFKEALGDKPNQKDRLREEVNIRAHDLYDFWVPDGAITEAGLRQNINVGIQYLDSWLRGIGAAAIFNLMEDAATAEISRAQLWQWIHHPLTKMKDGRLVSTDLYKRLVDEEFNKIRAVNASPKLETAKLLLDKLVLDPRFAEFLTLEAYDLID
jgi:malate synthase